MGKSAKIVIIGAGHVGSHCALSLALSEVAPEIVLVDSVPAKARAQALDVADALSFPPRPVTVRAGDYAEAADADIVIIAIGEPRQPGQTRLDLFDSSLRMLSGLVETLKPLEIKGIVVSITNPADIVAHAARLGLGLPRERCFGTGTLLDTARLARLVSEATGKPRSSVSALVMGEHGDSSVSVLSRTTVGGGPLDGYLAANPEAREALTQGTRQAGMTVIVGKGSTEFGIGQVTANLCGAILGNRREVFPLSVALEGEYGQAGINAGVPCRVGRNGIEEILSVELDGGEKAAFAASCDVIRGFVSRIRA